MIQSFLQWLSILLIVGLKINHNI